MASGLGTQVLENGRWVTRELDARAILARNRRRVEPQPKKEALPVPRPPFYGVVTQAMVDPPTIKYLLAARLRQRSTDDVVIVRARSVEFQEINEEYDLHHICPKVDMASSVRAARVFGSYEEPSDLLVEMDDVKIEADTEDAGQPSDLGPNMVVLALESKKLCFLFPISNASGQLSICQHHKELPSGQSFQERVGEHIAVDPASRALAVAAHENIFTFMSLKRRDVMVNEYQNSQSINPVSEEITVPVDGVIMKMEFLYPTEQNDLLVILLLLIHRNDKTRLLCYEWDSGTATVRTIRQVASGQVLRSDEQYPLLLIPLRFGTAFMLVCESLFTVYRDILSGSATSSSLALSYMEDAEEPGLSAKFPIFTQWARPNRLKSHTLQEDNIYLCREDGVVSFLEIKDREPGQMIQSQSQVGRLKVNVNTAFASLSFGSNHDLIAAGGDMSDGGIWELRAREDAERKSTISNWTPMSDLVIVKNKHHQYCRTFGKNPLFACSGRGNLHGAIMNVKYGVRAPSNSTNDLKDLGSIPLDMWVLSDEMGHDRRFVFISYPTSTSQFTMEYDDQSLPDLQGVEQDTPTIAVGSISGGLIAQVTGRAIHLISSRHAQSTVKSADADARIVAASFLDSTLILSATERHDGTTVALTHITYDASGAPDLTPNIPNKFFRNINVTGLALHRCAAGLLMVLGTSAGQLFVFVRLDDWAEVGHYDTTSITGSTSPYICDSITLFDYDAGHRVGQWVLCGLRNGSVLVFDLQDGETWRLELIHFESLGTTSLRIHADANRAVILHCDDRLYHLNMIGFQPHQARFLPLYIDRQDTTSLRQDKITALAKVPLDSRIPDDPLSTWMCMDRHHLLQFNVYLEEPSTLIPRRVPIHGNPMHMLFWRHLEAFVIIFSKFMVDDSQQPGIRRLQHCIQLFDLEGVAIREPVDIDLRSGEKIEGMTEWYPHLKDEGTSHAFLLIHTSIAYGSQHPPGGRILISRITLDKHITFKSVKDFSEPVYCTAAYDNPSFLYCSGNHMGRIQVGIKDPDKKPIFAVSKEVKLASRGSHLSAGPIRSGQKYIYVSTEEHSLQVYREETMAFTLVFSDPQHRASLCHLKLPDLDIVLSASKDKLHGLWLPPNPRVDGAAPVLFSASLPGSIRNLIFISDPNERPCIIGSGIDGSIYRIILISEHPYRHMVEAQRRLCADYTSDEPRTGRSLRHIDVDLHLRRLGKKEAKASDIADFIVRCHPYRL